MNRQLFRRIHANANLIALNTQYGNSYVITDDDGLANAATQDEHGKSPENLKATTAERRKSKQCISRRHLSKEISMSEWQ
jgi:hypothetical protein